MERFVKFFYGLPSTIEREINEFAVNRKLIIISCSIGINQGREYVMAIFEKPCLSYDEPTEKWIISSDGYYPYCSHCKTEPENGVMSKYCPECGARMDGEK